jgi:glyoxylase-like metal-dependent hydrolase (beta-lactamase superfamily II)
MPDLLAPTVDQLPDGVLRAELPTPFAVGPVNCYLLVDDPVTIVDPGMLWGDTTAAVEQLLARAGLRVGDVEQVLVTHGHPDHFGVAGWVAERSGAPVLCGQGEERKLVDGYAATTMIGLVDAFGIPAEVRAEFPGFAALVAEITHPLHHHNLVLLADHERVRAGGRDLDVHVTPGHAVGHVSLYDAATNTLLSGDHLLPRITPNPLIEPDHESPLGRRRSLVEYLASLDRFTELPAEVVLPGHGPGFTDIAQLVDTMRVHHARRAEDVLDAVRVLGQPTAFELSCHLFPKLEGFAHMLGISEAIGHLDLLVEEEQVVCGDGVPLRYAAA